MSRESLEKLDDNELKLISDQSGVEFGIVKSWYKEFLSVCPSGKLDKKHFYEFYKQLRVHSNESLSKITDYVFSSFDRDGNQFLEFGEFLIAYAATSNSQPLKKLDFIFRFYDSDKDGRLTDEEFLMALERLYAFRKKDSKEYPPHQCVRDLFIRIDENGDRRLTKEEFIEGCMKNKNLIELLSPFEIN